MGKAKTTGVATTKTKRARKCTEVESQKSESDHRVVIFKRASERVVAKKYATLD
jgi:hypothetical protein